MAQTNLAMASTQGGPGKSTTSQRSQLQQPNSSATGGSKNTPNRGASNIYIALTTGHQGTISSLTSPLWNTNTDSSTLDYSPTRVKVDVNQLLHHVSHLQIPKDHALVIEMPDGSKIILDANGNYTIEDKDAKITYKANNIRNFNPYINASDLLEQFIEWIKTLNVSQQEFMNLPIELFIKWLVVEAARADGDQPDIWSDDLHKQALLPAPKPIIPRCLACGKFIRHKIHKAGINFCNSVHMETTLRKFA
jgi:hypothetical protein